MLFLLAHLRRASEEAAARQSRTLRGFNIDKRRPYMYTPILLPDPADDFSKCAYIFNSRFVYV